MNKPIHPVIASNGGNVAYESDLYGWAVEQAGLLRAGKLEAIDWTNIAEEIEDVAKREASIAETVLAIALMHVLKWQHQPSRRSNSWRKSIREHLRRFDRQMRQNPSLKPQLEDILAEAYARARYDASEETGLEMEGFPLDPPSWEIIRGPFEVDADLHER